MTGILNKKSIISTKYALRMAFSAAVALGIGSVVLPAHAEDRGDEHRDGRRGERHEEHREDRREHREYRGYGGGYYEGPPVVYGSPCGYGGCAPPVIYGPGVGIVLPNIMLNIH